MDLTRFIILVIYIGALAGVWALYGVSRVHVKRFEAYSHLIPTVSKVLTVLLIVFSIAGLVLVFMGDFGGGESVTAPRDIGSDVF